jgi:hypothetical protein
MKRFRTQRILDNARSLGREPRDEGPKLKARNGQGVMLVSYAQLRMISFKASFLGVISERLLFRSHGLSSRERRNSPLLASAPS